MTPEGLLQECEALTYRERIKRMVELGQEARQDANIRGVLQALMQGDMYQRVLALQSCYGSRDSASALRALGDSSRSVRSLALTLVPLVCSDEELQGVLGQVPLKQKEALLQRLKRRHRQEAIDRYIETLASQQNSELRGILPFASQGIVQQHVGQVLERFELHHWQRLVRMHPTLAAQALQQRARALSILDQRLLFQVNTVLPLLIELAPDEALALVREMTRLVPLARLSIETLAQRRPAEVLDLFLQQDEQCHVSFSITAQKRLDRQRLLTLYTSYPDTVDPVAIKRLRPEQRLPLYEACARGWRNSTTGALDAEIVQALPTTQRIAEARRNLSLPILQTIPQLRLSYATFLPWDEVLTTVQDTLRSPDAELRKPSLRALIAAARYERTHLTDVLQFVIQRRNEQDPVRQEMLSALAELPPGSWQSEHLTTLTQIIRDALNARDLSSPWYIGQLILRLLPFHLEWGMTQLLQVYRESGQILGGDLDTILTDEQAQSLIATLRPLLRAWQEREHEVQLVRLAQVLGKRLRVIPELVALLDRRLDSTRERFVATTTLYLFAQHVPARLDAAVPRLLEADKSWILLPQVHMYLHRYRQNLLNPFLGDQAYEGRFASGQTRFVLPLNDGFFRWTPTQQERFAQTLLEVLGDQEQATQRWMSTLHQLAAMPALALSYLSQFANDPRQAVRDTALQVLGDLDGGQGVPILLEALNDERARVAIYALRRALLALPEEQSLQLLRQAPLKQVTVAKEVIRLIGELETEEAYQELLRLYPQELHRDVRVALLRALWPYVEQEETWRIFNEAAQAPEAAIARGVVRIPADGISVQASKRLARLLSTLLTHPEVEVRIEALQRCIQQPVTDSEQALLPPLLRLLHSQAEQEYSMAAQAVFSLYAEGYPTLLAEAIQGLLTERRALLTSMQIFIANILANRQRLISTTRALLVVLAQDRLTITLRVKLLLAGLPLQEVAPELDQLRDSLHADALKSAAQSIEQGNGRSEVDLQDLEAALAASKDERLRRLALSALIGQTKQSSGWSDERIARLETYRNDPSVLVAETAHFTFPF